MRVEFRQGVPDGCIKWLQDNVGEGNIYVHDRPGCFDVRNVNARIPPTDKFDAWFYERIVTYINPQPFGDDSVEYTPTITVKDEKLAMLFALKWA